MTIKEIEEAMEKAVNEREKEEKHDNQKKEAGKQKRDEKKEDLNKDKFKEEKEVENKEIENKEITLKEMELKKTIEDLTDTLKRVQAEFINYKNRAEKEKIYCIEYGNADLIKKLLPVLDSFEMAMQNASDFEKFKKGMELVYAQLYDILEHEGLRKIDCNGKFDPYKHEVLMKAESDKEEDIILQELQKGYMIKDKVLRHSKVKISSGKEPEKNSKSSEKETK